MGATARLVRRFSAHEGYRGRATGEARGNAEEKDRRAGAGVCTR